jgi:hypothetical protein
MEDMSMIRNLAALILGEPEDRTGDEPRPVAVSDHTVIAWINANPPDLPMHQNHCAACGEYIPVYDTGWVYLGDGALVHHGGERGRECLDRWQVLRRAEALEGLGESERRRPHAAPVTATAD